MDNVILNKTESIERCIRQIRTYFEEDPISFREDQMRQDAIILNIERACEQSISLANHLVRVRKLGFPKTSKESFQLLAEANLIDNELSSRLQSMVGFRNIAVHNYQKINLEIVEKIINEHLEDFTDFSKIAINLIPK